MMRFFVDTWRQLWQRSLNLNPSFWQSGLICLLPVVISVLTWSWGTEALAASTNNILSQPVTALEVSLGNSANELKFFPNQLELKAGQRYKLLLRNPSSQKHYFTAKDFADGSWTQKVEAGKVEIKGSIRELELKPGAEAEWFLVPLKPGTYNLRCTIPGHTEAGMTGNITVTAG
jgi:uncharacterized cupredoxin-like copper-binding protein